MYGRPTILFPLALLALLALLTLWIDHNVQAPEPKPAGNTRHDPDYYLKNFVTSKTDAIGNLQHMLAAVSMTHYPDDDSTTLERPRFTQYGVGKPYTQIEGQRGLISSNGETVEFMDNVKVVRQATADKGEMTMLTDTLKIYPNKDLAITDKPVVITQAPKTVIHAIGMIFDKKQKTVTLLKKVRVHYEKPSPPQTAVQSKATGKKILDKKPAKKAEKTSLQNGKNSQNNQLNSNTTNLEKRHATTAKNDTRR